MRRRDFLGTMSSATVALIAQAQLAMPQPVSISPIQFPTRLNSNRSAFLDQYGSLCFACGDAPQFLPSKLSSVDVEFYLADRQQRGMNLLWMIMANYAQTNASGDPPFNGADFTNFNKPYWAFIDHIMQRALTYGQTVLFMPMFCGISKNVDGYMASVKTSSDGVLKGYADFITDRYRNFPNLIWLLGGDADPNDVTLYAKLNTFAERIKSGDSTHLITIEGTRYREDGRFAPNGGYSSVDALTLALGSVPSWLDINWVYQTRDTVVSGAHRCYSQGYPCIMGEDWYELEHSTTPSQLRTEGYGSILGGCSLGRVFGNNAIWAFSGATDPKLPTWQSQLGSVGSIGQQLLGKLFRSRDFALLIPDTSNVVMTTGAVGGSVCARTSDGSTIIVYLPSRQTITIDMTKITDPGNTAKCNWFNPRTGAAMAIGSLTTFGSHDFMTPDTDDWVLVIDSVAADLRTPGT
jgi:hypothetical protein